MGNLDVLSLMFIVKALVTRFWVMKGWDGLCAN